MIKKIRFLALLAGLAFDLVGTLVFAVVLGAVGAVVAISNGMGVEVFLEKMQTDALFLLVQYAGGIVFTLGGAFLVAYLSRPYSLLNSFLYGLVSTLFGLLFIFALPIWYSVLCVLTVIPVSLIPGYLLSPKMSGS